MNLEIIEFYPTEIVDDGYLSGSIKIRLTELAINVLGIYVCRRTNGKWLILMPCRTGVDQDGKRVKYPIVAFDIEYHKELMAELYAQVPGFIEKRLADTENPVVFPALKPINQQPSQPNAPLGAQSNQVKGKAAPVPHKASCMPQKSQKAAAAKVWRDLSPKKAKPGKKERYG